VRETDPVGSLLCYTYTCEKTVPPPLDSGKAEYCPECKEMLAPHEEACKEMGIEPWDETFVIFRAGVLAERKQAVTGGSKQVKYCPACAADHTMHGTCGSCGRTWDHR